MKALSSGALILMLVGLAWRGARAKSDDFPVPPGWRLPRANEVDQQWREDEPNRALFVQGDFTGHGGKEEARILVRSDNKVFAAFVKIVASSGEVEVRRLSQLEDRRKLQSRGLQLMPAGSYHQEGETPFIAASQVIMYFELGSASVDYAWDKKTFRFKIVYIGD